MGCWIGCVLHADSATGGVTTNGYWPTGSVTPVPVAVAQLVIEPPLVPAAYVYIVRAYHAIGYTDQETAFCNALRQLYPQLADAKRYCGNGTAGR